MLRSSQRKRVQSTRYHPFLNLETRVRKMYYYTDENGDSLNELVDKSHDTTSCLFNSRVREPVDLNASFVSEGIRSPKNRSENSSFFTDRTKPTEKSRFLERQKEDTLAGLLRESDGNIHVKPATWEKRKPVVVKNSCREMKFASEQSTD